MRPLPGQSPRASGPYIVPRHQAPHFYATSDAVTRRHDPRHTLLSNTASCSSSNRSCARPDAGAHNIKSPVPGGCQAHRHPAAGLTTKAPKGRRPCLCWPQWILQRPNSLRPSRPSRVRILSLFPCCQCAGGNPNTNRPVPASYSECP